MGGPPVGGGLGMPLGPMVLDIPSIIAAVAAVAAETVTQGYATATASASSSVAATDLS